MELVVHTDSVNYSISKQALPRFETSTRFYITLLLHTFNKTSSAENLGSEKKLKSPFGLTLEGGHTYFCNKGSS